jgi:hypothetical protein
VSDQHGSTRSSHRATVLKFSRHVFKACARCFSKEQQHPGTGGKDWPKQDIV